MKPTKEQLADPKWWGEDVLGYKNYIYWDEEWGFATFSKEPINEVGFELLAKRPEPEQWKPKAPSLPDIGTEVDIVDNGSLVYGQGESGEVIGHIENCAIVRMSYGLGCFEASYLKIKKTQREEFIEKASRIMFDVNGEVNSASLGALYDEHCRFDLTEKDGE